MNRITQAIVHGYCCFIVFQYSNVELCRLELLETNVFTSLDLAEQDRRQVRTIPKEQTKLQEQPPPPQLLPLIGSALETHQLFGNTLASHLGGYHEVT